MNLLSLRRTVVCLLVGLSCSLTNADIIGNFDGLNFSAPSLPGNGQFDAPGAITVDTSSLFGGATGFIVYNLSGLNVTGDATANDTATFRINVAATGGTIADATSETRIGVAGNGASGLSDSSEALTFSFDSGSVTLGDPGTGAMLNFIGFRNLDLNGFTDDDAIINGSGETAIISGGTLVDGTYADGDDSAFSSTNAFGSSSTFTIGAGNGTDNFSVNGFGARLEFLGSSAAVPEPGSFAILSFVCIGLMVFRRRRMQQLCD